ncbi:MAG: non-canonical purine pyrophosphatase, rdgB/HAM1 family [Cytophagaceae bacterium]|jgi:XTP/dITP diphosphohydrolase|nr:non-canonical purine pyrophosphatase, rdgB/HAM1 family [Cytophagaceae bacterium]
MEIIFATHNKNKLKEVQSLVPANIKVISLDDLNMTTEIPETGHALADNALIKARTIFELYKKPVIADDTGLEVTVLNGAPGVYSARYAGEPSNAENNMNLLLENLEGKADRSAHFKTVIAYINAEGKEQLFEGRVDGEIIAERRGGEGFGYDPVFLPTGYAATFAEMPLEEKNQISHRARALRAFSEFINKV